MRRTQAAPETRARGLVGLVAYMSLWILSALLAWSGPAGGAMLIIALLLTWVAATVGFGATLISRGGTSEPARPSIPVTRTAELDWQTPTPVAGWPPRAVRLRRPAGDGLVRHTRRLVVFAALLACGCASETEQAWRTASATGREREPTACGSAST